jgi:hypothetical protein
MSISLPIDFELSLVGCRKSAFSTGGTGTFDWALCA